MELNDDYNPVAKETLKFDKKTVFEIGNQDLIKSAIPGFYKHNEVFFVDFPGIEDCDISNEYPKQAAISLV
jgi:hypothetical protein